MALEGELGDVRAPAHHPQAPFLPPRHSSRLPKALILRQSTGVTEIGEGKKKKKKYAKRAKNSQRRREKKITRNKWRQCTQKDSLDISWFDFFLKQNGKFQDNWDNYDLSFIFKGNS